MNPDLNKTVKVEICIECDELTSMAKNVRAAYQGGAARVELCSNMQCDGLTPAKEFIEAASEVFHSDGILAMIRPRPGDFSYSPEDLIEMKRQINIAAAAGAAGVVFGALQHGVNEIAIQEAADLLQLSKDLSLKTTFHRAFDVTPDPLCAMDSLIQMGFDRVLTSGTPWKSKSTTMDRYRLLSDIILKADQRIELVLCGGVNPHNAAELMGNIPRERGPLSVHAYSGVLNARRVSTEYVKALSEAVNAR